MNERNSIWSRLEDFVLAKGQEHEYVLPFYYQAVRRVTITTEVIEGQRLTRVPTGLYRDELVQVHAVRIFDVSPSENPLWLLKFVSRLETDELTQEPSFEELVSGDLADVELLRLVNALEAHQARIRPTYLDQYPHYRATFDRVSHFLGDLQSKKLKIKTTEAGYDPTEKKRFLKQIKGDLYQLASMSRELLEEHREHELINMFARVMKQHGMLGQLLEGKGPEDKIYRAIGKEYKALRTAYLRYWFYVGIRLLPASEPLPTK